MSEEGVRRNLDEVLEEKDLGVKFDPTLLFSKHTATITKKANSMVGIIRRTFDHMDKDMLKIMYKTLIRPHVEYANCIWSPILKKDADLVAKVQRQATKLVPHLKEMAYSDTCRLRQLNLPTLAYRRLRGDLIQTYKIMNGVNKVDKESVGFQMVERESGTRGHQFKVQKQHTRLSLRQNAFSN